jgi:hypothetical protein
LQTFLARWGPRLDERLGSSRVIANTREHGERRVAALRALGAPAVVVAREAAELARVSSPDWRPRIVPARLVPDVIGAASLVGAGTHPLDGPLAIDADVSDLVLLAAACCVSVDAEAVREPWLDALTWRSVVDVELDDSPVPDGFVRVRPGVYPHEVQALALAEVHDVPYTHPIDALLRVVIPTA